MFVKTIHILTKVYNELDIITPQVEEAVAESGIQDGMVTVITKHTTTGITVNEAPVSYTHLTLPTNSRV